MDKRLYCKLNWPAYVRRPKCLPPTSISCPTILDPLNVSIPTLPWGDFPPIMNMLVALGLPAGSAVADTVHNVVVSD